MIIETNLTLIDFQIDRLYQTQVTKGKTAYAVWLIEGVGDMDFV